MLNSRCLREFAFDPVAIPNFSALVVGKRNSGKSTTAHSIALSFPGTKWHVWVGGGVSTNEWKSRNGYEIHSDDDYGLKYLDKILERDQVGCIFDDVPKIGDVIGKLLGKRVNIIVCCQYVKELLPYVREHIDYVFMMYNSKRTLRLLYDHMDNPVSSEAFTIIHREITSGQRKVLVFENRQNPFGDPIPFSIYGA